MGFDFTIHSGAGCHAVCARNTSGLPRRSANTQRSRAHGTGYARSATASKAAMLTFLAADEHMMSQRMPDYSSAWMNRSARLLMDAARRPYFAPYLRPLYMAAAACAHVLFYQLTSPPYHFCPRTTSLCMHRRGLTSSHRRYLFFCRSIIFPRWRVKRE